MRLLSRRLRLALDDRQKPQIDDDFEEATEGEEVKRKEKLKTKWAQLEAVVGAAGRIRQVAADIVEHYETRLDAMDGKAMVVCMSRRICVDLHNELVRLRPDWRHPDDDQGSVKVVMTGSASDPLEWQPHIRNKPRREALANSTASWGLDDVSGLFHRVVALWQSWRCCPQGGQFRELNASGSRKGAW